MGLGPLIISRNISRGKYGYVPHPSSSKDYEPLPKRTKVILATGAIVLGTAFAGTIALGVSDSIQKANKETPYNLIIVVNGEVYRRDDLIQKGEVKERFKVLHPAEGITAFVIYGTDEVDKNTFTDLVESYIVSNQEEVQVNVNTYEDLQRTRK